MPMKVYIDNSNGEEWVNNIKSSTHSSDPIEWVDTPHPKNEDVYVLYTISPNMGAFNITHILSHIAFIKRKNDKLIVCTLIKYKDKTFSSITIQTLRIILSLLSSMGAEVFYNIHDLIFYLEETSWKHALVDATPKMNSVKIPKEEEV